MESNIHCSSNMDDLRYMKKKLNPSGKSEVKMLSDFIPGQKNKEVPDCYYANGIVYLFYNDKHRSSSLF